MMTDEFKAKLGKLVMLGRVTATGMLEKAIETAENTEQLQDQVFMLRCSAVHLLATCIYNEVEQSGRTVEEAFETIQLELEAEFDELVGNPGMTLHKLQPKN